MAEGRARMPPKQRRDIPNPNRIETLDVFNPCIAATMIVLMMVFMFVLAFTPGWYYVHFTDDTTGPLYCQLSLTECTLADCKADSVYTGYIGEGDCRSWHVALFLFICAASYAGAYAFYMAGILHGQAGNWRRYAEAGRYSGCCVDTTLDLGELCSCCEDKGPCRGKLAHGVLGLGTPILMLLAMVNVVNQDLSHFDGIDAGFGVNFYLCLALMVVCSGCIVAIGFDASNDEEAIKAKLGARVASRALPERPQRPAAAPRPTPRPGEAAADDDEDDGPTEGERVAAALGGFAASAKKAGAGALAKAQELRGGGAAAGGGGGGGGGRGPPPPLPSRSGTPPRAVPTRP